MINVRPSQGNRSRSVKNEALRTRIRTIVARLVVAGRWATLSLVEQMAHVGSEVERTIAWRNGGREEMAMRAFERALELLDLTLADDEHQGRRRELARVREGMVDHFLCDNEYRSQDRDWLGYVLQFATAARAGR